MNLDDKRYTWTDEQKKQLRTLVSQGLKIREIAEKMGKKRTTISMAMAKYELKKRREWTDEDISFIKENVDKMDDAELGVKFNVTSNTIYLKRVAHNIVRTVHKKK